MSGTAGSRETSDDFLTSAAPRRAETRQAQEMHPVGGSPTSKPHGFSRSSASRSRSRRSGPGRRVRGRDSRVGQDALRMFGVGTPFGLDEPFGRDSPERVSQWDNLS